LAEAERWANEHSEASLPVDAEFLNASRAEQRRLDLERRAARWKLIAAVTTSVLTIAALVAVGFALLGAVRGQREARAGERDALRALEAVTACVQGDNEVCDDLYERTGEQELAGTCGFRSEFPRGGRCELEAQRLHERCEEGSMRSCDELYYMSGDQSDDVDFAATCGGRSDGSGAGNCEFTNGEGFRQSCASGDMAACDALFYISEVGSDDEAFGATCGGRSTEDVEGLCEETFGSSVP
jgi:hypothetical protein